MFVGKLLIAAVLLCILLSLLSSGLVAAALNLCAFTLLLIYLFKGPRSRRE